MKTFKDNRTLFWFGFLFMTILFLFKFLSSMSKKIPTYSAVNKAPLATGKAPFYTNLSTVSMTLHNQCPGSPHKAGLARSNGTALPLSLWTG